MNLSAGARVSCTREEECPPALRCEASLSLCVPLGGDDTEAPRLLASSINPPVGTLGTPFTIVLRASEALFVPPRIFRAETHLFDAVESGDTWTFSYAPMSVDEAPLSVQLIDVAGNSTVSVLPALALDVTGPVISRARWSDAAVALNASAVLTLTAESEADASLRSVTLVDQNEMAIAEVVASAQVLDIGSGKTLVIAASISLDELALSPSTTAVSVRLVVLDPYGNATTVLLPFRMYDLVPPVVTFSALPEAGARWAQLVFTSEEGASHFCSLDAATEQPCTSPWRVLLSSHGVHTAQVRAIDAAGNTGDVATHIWSFAPKWKKVVATTDRFYFSIVSDAYLCALATEGSIWCWGEGLVASAYQGTVAASPRQMSPDYDWEDLWIGPHAVCALRQRQVFCLGRGPQGDGSAVDATYAEFRPTVAGDYVQMAIARDHRCGITRDQRLWCWGTSKGVGVADGAPHLTPQEIAPLGGWLQIVVDAGLQASTCGLREEAGAGVIYCWGHGGAGQLGDGASADRPFPTRISDAQVSNDWLALSAVDNRVCALHAGGGVWCWGNALLSGSSTNVPTLLDASLDGVEISMAKFDQSSVCVREQSGLLSCLGRSVVGAGGRRPMLGPGASITTFTLADPELHFLQVAVSAGGICGLREDGDISCWGTNGGGLLANGVRDADTPPPAPVSSSHTFTAVETYSGGGCAIADDTSLHCWGGSPGSDFVHAAPTRMGTEDGWVQISTYGHTCGIRAEAGGLRHAYCAGNNNQYQLGTGVSTEAPGWNRVGVTGDVKSTWQRVDPGYEFTLGLLDAAGGATLWRWGRMYSGAPQEMIPTQVGAADDWLAIVARGSRACGIRNEGGARRLYCFGEAPLGVSAGASSTTPVQIAVGTAYETGWQQIAMSPYATCGINQQKLFCWCGNDCSGTGLGQASAQATPKEVTTGEGGPIDSDWAEVHLGAGGPYGGMCAKKQNGNWYCAGDVGSFVTYSQSLWLTPVSFGAGWQTLSMHGTNACGIRADGVLECAGSATAGARGDGRAFGPFDFGVPEP